MEGIVIKSTGSWYKVQVLTGEIFDCKIKGNFKIKGIKSTNPVSVGDYVIFEKISNTDETCLITNIKDRKNAIMRKSTNLSHLSHIIAANVDQAVLVITLFDPRTSTGFIDRFLVTAEAYHIPTTLIYNKADMYIGELAGILEEEMNIYRKIGYDCLVVSSKNGKNIDQFKELLINKTTLIAGHSGVGKSTLVNTIQPHLDIKIGEISQVHSKGKHTTTFAEMHQLSFGGFIIDTPGIKEFGLVYFEDETLGHRFPEFRTLINQCRFDNCMHTHEPGCIIKQAVLNGDIAESRYNSYLSMLEKEDNY